ncbi:MAG: M6 family metalloprotease domain-containing protein [Prevotella sp.]|nr:M6 family metalloprotease domain-containing protein [Prevotella sp.]
MKRLFMILMAVAMFLPQLQAVPAEGNPVKVKQPDGTYLTIRLVGDEFMSFNVTEDGFTVVKNEEGYYVYAQQAADGELVPTTQIAHDEAQRQGEEQSFLHRTRKFLQPKMTPAMAAKKQREYGLRRQASDVHRAPKYDYTKFRGLVVLVEYNDRTFGDERYKDIITDMISKENYTGYVNYNNARVNCTGSVVDYFRDNSMGVFVPQFDVIGPVTVDRSQYYARNNATQLTYDVINLIDKDVNFANYDGDNDGVVDMIYFVFAGHPSSYNGNNGDLLWPHAYYIYQSINGYLYYVNKDGKRLGRYACSTELQGPQTRSIIGGIGTICHEFSHVLGLPDFYDTDYAESGGRSYDPGNWTLMSQG